MSLLLGIPGKLKSIIDTLGSAGAGLTGVPWNAAWDAEVQSECTDALNAYDPPTKAEMDTALASAGKHLKFIATGALYNNRTGTSTGEDASYLDTTVSGITDYTNCIVILAVVFEDAVATNTYSNYSQVTGRLTSNTNLRLGTRNTNNFRFSGRWTILEAEVS